MKTRILLALVLLLGIGGVYYFLRSSGPNKSVAVVPARWTFLDPAGLDARDEQVAETVIRELTARGKVPVVPWATIGRFRGNSKSSPDIAHDLGVTLVLAISVRPNGSQSRVSAVLAEPLIGRMRWTEDFYAQDLNSSGAMKELISSICQDLETALGYHH